MAIQTLVLPYTMDRHSLRLRDDAEVGQCLGVRTLTRHCEEQRDAAIQALVLPHTLDRHSLRLRDDDEAGDVFVRAYCTPSLRGATRRGNPNTRAAIHHGSPQPAASR